MTRLRPPRISEWILRAVLPAGEHGRSIRADLLEEFRAHARGRSVPDARRWYRRQAVSLGVRYLFDRRQLTTLDTVPGDIRYAVRSLAAAPGFTATVVTTLAITIGAATAMFAVVNAVLIRPLPYRDSDRLMLLAEKNNAGVLMSISWPSFVDWRARVQSFEEIAGYRSTNFAILDPEAPDRVRGRQVTGNYFRVLGIQPAIGRDFVADDDHPGATPVVLVSHGYAQRRFGSAAAAPAQDIRLGNRTRTIVGVLPASLPIDDDIFEPLGLSVLPTNGILDRGNHTGLLGIAHLRDGVSEAAAREELIAVAAALSREYPATNSGISADVQPLADLLVGDFRPVFLALSGAVAFLLLLGCANAANLLISRGVARGSELALRAALGCGRLRLVRQLLLESAALATAGGALGLGLGWVLLKGLLAVAPSTLPRLNEISFDATSVVFALGVTLSSALLVGIIPAIQASGARGRPALLGATRGLLGSGGSLRLRRGLLIVEVSLAVLLLAGAGLMVRTLHELSRVNLGFEPKGLLTARLTPAGQGWDTDRLSDFGDHLLTRIRALPGVEAAAIAHSLPIEGSQWGSVFVVGDKPVPERANLPSANFNPVSEGYFETLRLRLITGRFFTAADRRGTPTVAVINETAARRLWPGEDPVGKRVKQGWPEWTTPWREIVGVVGDIKLNGVIADTPMQIYLPYAQNPSSPPAIVVRSSHPEGLARPIEAVVHELAPTMPVYAVRTLDTIVGGDIARERASMTLLAAFAGIALVLACVGLYGLVSYLVTQRTREVGVRVALGASSGHIVRLFLGFGLTTTIAGLAIGIAGAAALTSYLDALLFGVGPRDTLAFAGAAATLLVVALVACYVPARRAARVDPTRAMRTIAT